MATCRRSQLIIRALSRADVSKKKYLSIYCILFHKQRQARKRCALGKSCALQRPDAFFYTHARDMRRKDQCRQGRSARRCLQRLCRRLRCRRLGFYMHEAPSAEEGAVQCYSSHSHALSHTHSPLSPSTHWPSSSPKRKSSSSKNHSSSQTSALPSVITSQQR